MQKMTSVQYRIHTYESHAALHTLTLPFDQTMLDVAQEEISSTIVCKDQIMRTLQSLWNGPERGYITQVRAILITRQGLELFYIRNDNKQAVNYLAQVEMCESIFDRCVLL
jgi:hypothetical protein